MGFIVGRMNEGFKAKKKAEGLTRDDKKRLKLVHTRKKRVVLVLAIILVIGNLVTFKVLNFNSGLLLPIGLSFYTFQALSYFFDVYMDKYEPERNYLRFLLFVSWFPQMIQGPISRYDSLGRQFAERHAFKFENIKRAAFLFAFGLLKKYALADVLVKVVDASFKDVGEASGTTVVMGTLFCLIQLYCDFSGGIDMVLAVSRLFGLELKDNFNQPYFSPSLADFWHRWHITLGDWMRDYVFYPMAVTKPMMNLLKWGTAHCGKVGRIFPAVVGNIVVFFLVGVWHGTGWNYVVWGLYNGVIISLGELCKPVLGWFNKVLHIPDGAAGLKVWRIVRTDLLVAFGEVIVMVGDIRLLPRVLTHMVTRPDWDFSQFGSILMSTILKSDGRVLITIFLILAGLLVIVRSVIRERGTDMYDWICARHFALQSTLLCLVFFTMLCAFIFQNVGGGFLYANF
ncbi:MAG: MBOAT family protein [Eubacterium sp.]|nr:MBOAT family protein [Eubacterium sp.]